MGLKTKLIQPKKSKQTDDPSEKSPNNAVQHLCRQRKWLIENENIHKMNENVLGRSDQKQEITNESGRNSNQYFTKLLGLNEEMKDKENKKELETERDDPFQNDHLGQADVMMTKKSPCIKNEDQKEIPVGHVDVNISNKITLKQRKDQANLDQVQKKRNNNLKDDDSENKYKIGDNLQSNEIDNKVAYDSRTNLEKFPLEEETFVKMLSGGDENEDDNSIEMGYWESDGSSRCDSMDSLYFRIKQSLISNTLMVVPRDPHRQQDGMEKMLSISMPVVGHADNHKELFMFSDCQEEMKPAVTEPLADICRMEGDHTEAFEVSSLLSGEVFNIPLCVKLERSYVSQMVHGNPNENFIEKHEVDVLENEKVQFTEQPKLMIQVKELVCLLEEMKSYMSAVDNRMEKSPIHIFGLSDGSQHNDLPGYSNSGRGHSMKGTSQSGSPSGNGAAGDHQDSDRGKNKKEDSKKEDSKKEDSKKDEDHISGNNNANPEVNSPTVQMLYAQVPPLDFKTYRRKHGNLSIHELTMYLGYLGNLQVPSQEEAPPWQLHLEVNSCLEVVVDNFDPILDEALSCQICVTLSSHLKHFADCLSPYTSSCLICRQIFMFLCVHVKTCIDKTACLHKQREQPQQQPGQICTVSLCRTITTFVSGDVDKLYRTLSHIWPRAKKTLSGLLRSEEIWDHTEFTFPVKMPLGIRTSVKINTLPSIPEHESLPITSNTSFTCKTLKQVLSQSREGQEHDEGEHDNLEDHLWNASPVMEPNLVLGTTGIGNSSLEQPQNSVTESSSSSFSGIIYNDDTPSSLPDDRFQPSRGQLYSLIDRPMGTPGIGEVVYGNNKQLLKIAKFWGNLKDQYQKDGQLPLHYREEGVILSEYKKQLQIMKTRYQENFQYEKLVHLGNGMSGKCHLAQDWNTEYKFCLKKIHISHYEEKEIEIWSELQNAYIVKLYGAIRLGEMVSIMAEFIDGGCLTEAINTQRSLNCRLSHRLALHYFKQLLQVLNYLKNKHILHEDLKADNILLSQNDRSIRVADFGLARRNTHQKKGEQPFGTQTQWSPEKAGSKGHGFPSEVWAAVCVLVHMLSGYPPWVRRFPDAKLLHFVIVENSPPIQDIPKNVHPLVQDLIVQGLELDPEKRLSAEALLKHKAFTLFENGPPSDQIYSTLMTSSGAALLPLNHLDENTSILQEIYHSLAIPSVPQGANSNENSLATPIAPQDVTLPENKYRNSIVSLPSQQQSSTSQKGEPVNGLQSAELSTHLEWLKVWQTTPQVPPDTVAMPVFVNLDQCPIDPQKSHFYDYLYDDRSTPQQPDHTELQEYVPDDVSSSGSSYQSYNLSGEGVNSNLPNFLLLNLDLQLENFKQEMGLETSDNTDSVVRQEERAEIPDYELYHQHDNVDSFELFGDGRQTIPTLPALPEFGDIASLYPGEMFMLTNTTQTDQQLPCSKCAEPIELGAVSEEIIPSSAKMQESKLLLSSAKHRESSQSSCNILDMEPKDQQSCMTCHLSQPIIQTPEYLNPPTPPNTAPPDHRPFPERAVATSSQRRIDQDNGPTLLETIDNQRTSAITPIQRVTLFNPQISLSSARLPSEKLEKDFRNELLKQAASETVKLSLNLTKNTKSTQNNLEKKAPSTAPVTSTQENKDKLEHMWRSYDETSNDLSESNNQSTPSPLHTTPKSRFDEQEEEFRKLETESQQSDDIFRLPIDDDNDRKNQVNAELSVEHDDDTSLQYVVNTYLDNHDQSTESSLSLTFVNQSRQTLMEMRVTRQTNQSWLDFIDREFCQDNSCHDQFKLAMFNFRHADGTLVNLDDNIGDENKTVLVSEAIARDAWFIEHGILKQF